MDTGSCEVINSVIAGAPALDPRLDDYNWEHIFEGGERYTCPVHVRTRQVLPFGDSGCYARADVKSIVAIDDGENDERDWVGVFLMVDGKYLVVRAGCDYTGWGCQESGNSDVADTLEDAIALGLTHDERTRLADQLAAVA